MAFSRRYLLAQGARIASVAGPAVLAAWLGWPEPAKAVDWRALFRETPTGGHGTVKKMVGTATTGGRPLAPGARVESGEQIRVARKSWVILSLSDNTILRVSQRTVFTLDIGIRGAGFFQLLVGAVLTVVPTGNRYLVQLPTATVGIKGTVFFHQIYHPDELVATDAKNRKVEIPEGISEYFCLCNGLADFLKQEQSTPFFSDNASYHNSYFIDPSLPDPLVPAPQLNHTDRQIEQLVDLQSGPKQDLNFLQNYQNLQAEP